MITIVECSIQKSNYSYLNPNQPKLEVRIHYQWIIFP